MVWLQRRNGDKEWLFQAEETACAKAPRQEQMSEESQSLMWPQRGNGHRKRSASVQVRTLMFLSRVIGSFKQAVTSDWSSSHLQWRPLSVTLWNWELLDTGIPVQLSSPSATQARAEGDISGIPLYNCIPLNLSQLTTSPQAGGLAVCQPLCPELHLASHAIFKTALLGIELWLISQQK